LDATKGAGRSGGNLDGVYPSFDPFNHADAFGADEIGLEAGGDDLVAGVEAVEIQMEKGESATGVLVDEGVGGGNDGRGGVEAAGQAFD